MPLPKDIFLPSTFWDADFEKLDLRDDKNFIITRVLTKGSDNEIFFVLNFYDKNTILNILNKVKGVDEKTKNFFNLVL